MHTGWLKEGVSVEPPSWVALVGSNGHRWLVVREEVAWVCVWGSEAKGWATRNGPGAANHVLVAAFACALVEMGGSGPGGLAALPRC